MPPRAYRYAVPGEWYTEHGVRRYGFHGTSHRYVSQRAAELLDRPMSQTLRWSWRTSATGAARQRCCGGRVGRHDDGPHAARGAGDGDTLRRRRSGLVRLPRADWRGLSGADVIDVAQQAERSARAVRAQQRHAHAPDRCRDGDDPDAPLAIDVFCYRAGQDVAGLVVALGRLDALVFTGGIGENDVACESRVVGLLAFLGLRIDVDAPTRSTAERPKAGSSDGDGPTALVVPTDEELMIARDTLRLVRLAHDDAHPARGAHRAACRADQLRASDCCTRSTERGVRVGFLKPLAQPRADGTSRGVC